MKEDLSLPIAQDGSLWHYTNLGRILPPHHHDEIEINLVTRGHGAYLLGERRYALRPGSLVWLFPAQNHVLLEQSPDYGMWIGVFKPSLVARVCTTPTTQTLRETDPPGWFCRTLSTDQATRLAALLREIKDMVRDTARLNAGLGYALLTAWASYQEAEDIPAGSDVQPAVERAVRLLREEIEPLSLEQMAEQAGLSPSRLSRLFRQQIGVPLVEFRNTQRMDRFLRLYGRGRRRGLTECALDAGFGSYPQFHRIFTRQMGCSPQEYRRRQTQGIREGDGEQGGANP